MTDPFPTRTSAQDADRVKGTPHMNWGNCVCSQCCIWRLVARLELAQQSRCDWDCDSCHAGCEEEQERCGPGCSAYLTLEDRGE